MKPTTLPSDFVSHHGVALNCTLKQLTIAFGAPPTRGGDGDNYHYFWTLLSSEGNLITLYDWNYKAAPQLTDKILWRIAGKSYFACICAEQEIRDLIAEYDK